MGKIHKEGRRILILSFIFLLLLDLAAIMFVTHTQVAICLVVGASVVFFLFLMYFFRVPLRELEPDKGVVYAPADGKIVVIEETEEKEYFKDRRLQVSIFMSPLDMHSNKYPVSGKVTFVNYNPGYKMVAWKPKSSVLNERSTTVIKTPEGVEVLVRQIAGAVARRIVTYSELGADVVQGDELGFIKFGSRVDLFLPEGTEIKVELFDKVKANKTVIATISSE